MNEVAPSAERVQSAGEGFGSWGKPVVSMVIPAYNSSKFIDETLESILNQDYRPIEVVVVDDGSTDDTVRRVRTFAEKYQSEDFVVKIVTQENQGVAAASNAGMKACTGFAIGFLGHDDLLPRRRSSILMSGLLGNNADVAFGRLESFTKPDELKGVMSRPIDEFFEVEILQPVFRFVPAIQAFLGRRDFLQRVGFYIPGLTPGEDVEFVTRMRVMAGKFVRTHSTVVAYRILPESLSRGRITRAYAGATLRAARAMIERFDAEGIWTVAENSAALIYVRKCLGHAVAADAEDVFKEALICLEGLETPTRCGKRSGIVRLARASVSLLGFPATAFILRAALRVKTRLSDFRK